MEKLLQLENAAVDYGGIHALDGVDIEIDEGEVVALMGPNGAGKSTVLRAMFGLTPIASGGAFFHGKPYAPVPHRLVRQGIAFVPQGRRGFRGLSGGEKLG